MTSRTMPICLGCRHYAGLTGTGCTAYPAGIPRAIIEDRFDHRSPYPGDHGIRFEPAANGATILDNVTRDRAAAGRVVPGTPR